MKMYAQLAGFCFLSPESENGLISDDEAKVVLHYCTLPKHKQCLFPNIIQSKTQHFVAFLPFLAKDSKDIGMLRTAHILVVLISSLICE